MKNMNLDSYKSFKELLAEADEIASEEDLEDQRVAVRIGPTNLGIGVWETQTEAHEIAHEIRRCARMLVEKTFRAARLAAREEMLGKADRLVDALLEDLRDRRGLRQAWDDIDGDIQAEIRAEWGKIVRKAVLAR